MPYVTLKDGNVVQVATEKMANYLLNNACNIQFIPPDMTLENQPSDFNIDFTVPFEDSPW